MIYGSQEFLAALREWLGKETYKENPYFKATVDHAEEMSPHMYGTKPEKLLGRVRPREDAETKKYRLESYEPTTLSTAEKGLSIVSKIWNPRVYSIKQKENDKGKAFMKYMTEEYPKYNSVVRYMQIVATKKELADPNGWIVVVPEQPENDPKQRPKPVAKLFGSHKLIYQDSDTLVFLLKVIKEKMEFEIMWIDKQVVMKVRIVLKPQEINLNPYWVYVHNEGTKMPAWQLQGTPYVAEDEDETVYFRSFFYPAVPFWNKAINAESDLDGAFINHIHPLKVEIATDCDNVVDGLYACNQGWIQRNTERFRCPACQGTGKKTNVGPYQTRYVSREKLDPDGPTAADAVNYVTVPIEPTELLDKRVDKLLERGLHALNMDIVNKIGENQSGIAKEQDRTELNEFLQRMADVGYDIHLNKLFWWCGYYSYAVDTPNWETEVLPEINKPSDFDINSLDDMLAQFKEATETGMNASYRKTKQVAIQNKEFTSYPDEQKRLNTILKLDPLPEANQEDLAVMLMNKTTTVKIGIIHSNLDAFVTRAIDENKDFLDLDYKKQMEIITKYAEEVEEENQAQLELQLDAIENVAGSTGGKPGQPDNKGAGGVPSAGKQKSGGNVEQNKPNSDEA